MFTPVRTKSCGAGSVFWPIPALASPKILMLGKLHASLLLCCGLYVSLTSSKILRLGIIKLTLVSALDFSYFGFVEDTSPRKKCKRACFFLSAYSYLCPMLREAIEIIPRCMRRRGAVVVATIFARALLNFVGLAVIVPVLVLILDGGSHLSPETPLGRAYTLSGFDSYASFTIAVCAAVIAVVAIKSLANILLCRIESRYIYDLYRRLSRSLFIRYHDRGLQFVKSSNSAVLARNINFVCLAAVTGILKPLSTIVCELMLVVLMFAAVALYSPAAALLVAAVFLPSAWLYLSAVRNRLEHYGVEENDAQRRKARIVAEALRGYADMEVGNAFPQTMRRFENETKMISEMRVRNTTLSMLPQAFTELGIVFGMSAMIVADIGMDSDRLRLLFGILAVAALRLMPSIRNILNSWTATTAIRSTYCAKRAWTTSLPRRGHVPSGSDCGRRSRCAAYRSVSTARPPTRCTTCR